MGEESITLACNKPIDMVRELREASPKELILLNSEGRD